jgi:NAD(P)-dependent dehydrogenase (short-subunit alcohol dehydrogenase family)
MGPRPDHGEQSYRGSGKLAGKKAVITGANTGIGRVACHCVRTRRGGCNSFAYLNEQDDAKETQRLVEEAGRKTVILSGDVGLSQHCRTIVDTAISELCDIDILVKNAAHQATFE